MDYTVYQRKSDNKWVGSFYYYSENGKRKKVVAYGKTSREATKKIREKIFEFENGTLKLGKDKTLLIDFLNDYVDKNSDGHGKKWESTTTELYRLYISTHIEPYFGNVKIDKLKPIDIDDFYYTKEETQSPNTVLKYHKFLKAAFNWGVKKDIIQKNVCDKVTPPKYVEYVPNIYEMEQFNVLWQISKETYDRVPISLGAGLGLRRGEIFGLKWSDIDFDNNTVHIHNTKVRMSKEYTKGTKNESSERIVTAPRYVIDVLRDYKKEKQVFNINCYILDNIKPDNYSKRFCNMLRKYKLPPTRLHDLRHYNATIMLDAGIPDKVAADRLGHKDTTMLKRVYQHTLKSMDLQASEILNDRLAK